MPRKHWSAVLKDRVAHLEAENKRLRDSSGSKGNDFSDLIEAISGDVKEVGANDVANMLLNDVCIKHNCREDVFIMEKGDNVRGQPFRLTDSTYKVVGDDMFDRILRETQVDAIQWQSNDYDCEDIARKFVTRCVDLGINSVGRVMSWSGGHAFCVAIIQDGKGVKPVFVEPQTDQIIESLTGKYSLDNALIVIA